MFNKRRLPKPKDFYAKLAINKITFDVDDYLQAKGFSCSVGDTMQFNFRKYTNGNFNNVKKMTGIIIQITKDLICVQVKPHEKICISVRDIHCGDISNIKITKKQKENLFI
jgi:hypothetical protein